jgi:glutaredoxin-like YruB-family protein
MSDQKTAIVYSTSWCAYCKQAKVYLQSKNVAVTEKNIEQDEAAHQELLAKTGGVFNGVPVIELGGELLQGFNRAAIDQALEN